MNEKDYYIPRELNAKALILIWEADTAVIAICFFLIFAMMGSVIVACISGYFAAKGWVKLKEEGGDGLLTRMVYWFLYSKLIVKDEKMQSEVREYIG